ncbi:MAG TPA: hypothetical protein VJQ59_16685 [Candidatus Sulfotelmatobacter sp.]|nr:hypothetical protein [Candidatus Sulfotelmatobacter sp.]
MIPVRQQQVNLQGYKAATFNVATLYQPGDLGQTFDSSDGSTYTVVQIESGATAPAAGQLMYWKDKVAKTVTNVVANARLGATTNAWRNEVAGVCMLAATAGNYICLLVKGTGISVACVATPGVGDIAIADSVTNPGNVAPITVGTAPTYIPVGVFTTVSSSNKASVDVNVPTLS